MKKEIEPYSATLLALAEDRRLKKGARTRLRLLSATAELLQGTFFHSLRVADICQGAGVSQGTFYLYFTDKADITARLLSDFTHMVYQELDSAKSKSVNSYDTIHAPTRTYVELFYQNRGLMRCLTQMTEESETFADLFRTLGANWNRRIAKNVQRTMSATPADEEVSLSIAYALASMVDEYLTKLYVRRDPALAFMAEDRERVATLLSKLWYRAVLLDQPTSPSQMDA